MGHLVESGIQSRINYLYKVYTALNLMKQANSVGGFNKTWNFMGFALNVDGNFEQENNKQMNLISLLSVLVFVITIRTDTVDSFVRV